MKASVFTILVLLVHIHTSKGICKPEIIRELVECEKNDENQNYNIYDNDYDNGHYNGIFQRNMRTTTRKTTCLPHSKNIVTGTICHGESAMPLWDNNDITNLTISDSNITVIKLNSFKNQSQLLQTKITNCNVSEVEFGAFNGIPNLQNLSLVNNVITKISKGIFNHLLHLKTLNLSNNRITYVEEGSFIGLDLERISISKNEIEDVRPFIESCHKLEVLDMSFNRISSLVSFENCSSLLEFHANNNRIKEVPPYLFKGLPLRMLDLSYNMLAILDPAAFVGGLDYHMTILDLSHNNISDDQLRIGIFQHLENLQKLNLSSNALTNLQLGVFSKLSKLTTLDVSFNALRSFPEEQFHDLVNLWEFYIHNNKLTSFKTHSPLRRINLDNNPWSCEELSRIVRLYNRAIIRGSNYNVSNIFGITCSPSPFNKNLDLTTNKLNENDKVDYAHLLGEVLEGIRKNNKEQFNHYENVSVVMTESLDKNEKSLKDLLAEFQNNNRNNQNVFSSIRQDLDKNQEYFKGILNRSENLSNTFKDYLRVIAANPVVKQTDESGTLKEFSVKIERQFEKLLGILNTTLSEKQVVQPYFDWKTTLNKSERQELKSQQLGRSVVGHVTENSNIFVAVLVVLILFLIAFCMTVFYFIRSMKMASQSSQMDEIQL